MHLKFDEHRPFTLYAARMYKGLVARVIGAEGERHGEIQPVDEENTKVGTGVMRNEKIIRLIIDKGD